jgi:alpha-galactosidase
MLAAPLLAGNDLRDMKPEILAILTNREVIAVDQDKDGKQGKQVWKSGDQEIWLRTLSKGAQAVAFFNRGAEATRVPVNWKELGIDNKSRLRDVWEHKDLATPLPDSFNVPGHGVVMLTVR